MKGLGDLVEKGLGKLGIHPWPGCPCPYIKRGLNYLTPGYRAPVKSSALNPTRQLLTYADGPVRTGRWRRVRMSYPGRPVGALFPFSAYPIAGGSPNVQSPSATQADINATIVNLASNGDTVLVPAEAQNWSGLLTISKGITLMGAGIGQTVVTDTKTRAPFGDGTLMSVAVPGGSGLVRLSGFSFLGGTPESNPSDATHQGVTSSGTITMSGCSTTTANYRIDNCRFNLLTNIVTRTFGHVYGVHDHNTALLWTGHHLLFAQLQSWPRDGVNCTGVWGDGSWHAALTPGTILANYIEDNTVTAAAQDGASGICDGNCGARIVVRYNTITDAVIGTHGTDTGQRERGIRWLESYENIIQVNYNADFITWQRGGSGVHFYNRITAPSGFNWLVKVLNLRSGDLSRPYPPWGFCDGTSVFDGNTGNAGSAGYRCLDQPGAGTSRDYNDDDIPANLTAQNTLEPVYIWNNTVNGVAADTGNYGPGEGVVVNGVDIGIAARPGYTVTTLPNGRVTAYTYPHPLVGGIIPPTITMVVTPNPVAPGAPLTATITRS